MLVNLYNDTNFHNNNHNNIDIIFHPSGFPCEPTLNDVCCDSSICAKINDGFSTRHICKERVAKSLISILFDATETPNNQ